jgi:protein-tyrosine phosphatase
MSDWFEHFGYAEVADDLLVGAYPQDVDDVAVLSGEGVTRVLNLVSDVEYDDGAREATAAALDDAGIDEERVQLVDYGGLLPGQIELAVRTVGAWLQEGARVYVHCRAGWQRSAAIAAAIVAVTEDIELDAALERIRERKPTADPLPHQRDDLVRWWSHRLAQQS